MTQVCVDFSTDHQVPPGYCGRSASDAASQRAYRRRPCRVWFLRPSQNHWQHSASGTLPGQHSGGLGYCGNTVLLRSAGPLLGNIISSCYGNVLDWCGQLLEGGAVLVEFPRGLQANRVTVIGESVLVGFKKGHQAKGVSVKREGVLVGFTGDPR